MPSASGGKESDERGVVEGTLEGGMVEWRDGG